MSIRARPRPVWDELPEEVRSPVEQLLGSAVVASTSLPGGWSPGSTDLVTTAGGLRAFVKTADARVNEQTVALHRREGQVLRLLGGGPAPRLIGEVDAAPWFGLVIEALDARHPDPRSDEDTAAVLDAVAALPDAPAFDLVPIEDELAGAALGWQRLRRAGATVHPVLEALAARMPEALRGTSVVHLDLRADNALIDRDGRGRLIDWPSAAVGARWLDAVTYLLDVRHLGGSAEQGLQHPVLRDVPVEDVDVWLSVLGAYFLDSARSPEPASLPGIRAYQRAQGETVTAWLRERRPELR